MNPIDALKTTLARRAFLANASHGLGAMALASLLPASLCQAADSAVKPATNALSGLPHFKPTAKRVLCLFQSEGFSHVDLLQANANQTSRRRNSPVGERQPAADRHDLPAS
jgi:hypothetical protein